MQFPQQQTMNELNQNLDDEIRIRGQIIALSLKLEDTLSKLIYSTFAPKNNEREILGIYLEEFVLPIALGKKIALYKQLLKTDTYQKQISEYLESKPSIIEGRKIHSASELTNFLNKNLSEILNTRNLIAHGMNVNDMANEHIDIENGSFIFANKLKTKLVNQESLKDFTEKTLLIAFMLLMINSPDKTNSI